MKKFDTFIIVVNDLEWDIPMQLGERIAIYIRDLNIVAEERKDFTVKVLSEFTKGYRKNIVLLLEWEE
jgi:hypothetical protein